MVGCVCIVPGEEARSGIAVEDVQVLDALQATGGASDGPC